MKFTGPTHIASITLASGPVEIKDGVCEIAEPTNADIMGLAANGFQRDYSDAPAPAPVAAAVTKSTSTAAA
jgi:hypothetical protein